MGHAKPQDTADGAASQHLRTGNGFSVTDNKQGLPLPRINVRDIKLLCVIYICSGIASKGRIASGSSD